MSIRVLIADDHTIVREGLRKLLSKKRGIEVVGDAGDGRSAVALAEKLKPEIVIMDVTMPELNGMEATRQILERVSGVKVIALSMHNRREFVQEMMRAGASAYLLKDRAFSELAGAVHAVRDGKTVISPGVKGWRRGGASAADDGAAAVLTPREREVLQLIAEGKTTKTMASALHVSVKTIETHRRHMMAKLGIHSIAKLTKYAITNGITLAEP